MAKVRSKALKTRYPLIVLLLAILAVGLVTVNGPTAAFAGNEPPISDGLVANNDGMEVVIPFEPSRPVAMLEESSATGFDVFLPIELTVGNGTIEDHGSVTYPSTPNGTTATVRALADGSVRIETTIPTAEAPREYTYAFGAGYFPTLLDDGAVAVFRSGENENNGFALINTPWAVDAVGAAVSTHYEVRGEQLVQVVEPSESTVYPVLADPAWNWVNFAYGAKFSRAETKTLASSGGVTGMCGALVKLVPAAAVAMCGTYGAYLFTQASIASADGECVFAALVPAPLVERYKDTSCR
ncbi:hypothetical protein BH09ACT1_BH09ACT1_27930 [soil metagenome]